MVSPVVTLNASTEVKMISLVFSIMIGIFLFYIALVITLGVINLVLEYPALLLIPLVLLAILLI